MLLPLNSPGLREEASGPVGYRVDQKKNGDDGGVGEFASRHAGSVWAQAEELLGDDIEFDALDQWYARAGLRRYRRLFTIEREHSQTPIAAALVYRGPTGFNFSFIENRCDLIVPEDADPNDAPVLLQRLLARVACEYASFSPACIPVVVSEQWMGVVSALGGRLYRRYSQAIWLNEGYTAMYRHIDRFYERLARAGARGGLNATTWRDRSQFVRENPDGSVVAKDL
jgi:hypothetical protein